MTTTPKSEQRGYIAGLRPEEGRGDRPRGKGETHYQKRGLQVAGMADGRTFGRRIKSASSSSGDSAMNSADAPMNHGFENVLAATMDKAGVPRRLRLTEIARAGKVRDAVAFWRYYELVMKGKHGDQVRGDEGPEGPPYSALAEQLADAREYSDVATGIRVRP